MLFFIECYAKPGSKDSCICPMNILNQKTPAVCHDREYADRVICHEENNLCMCPMPENDKLYQIECKKRHSGK